MPKKLKRFIDKSNINHNFKYDYSLVKYINSHTKVKIVCCYHGVFEQLPYVHIKGFGCPECSGKKKYTTETFIIKVSVVHNSKYDYSLVNYINSHTKIKIICLDHGMFEQLPYTHLQGGGCSKCSGKEKYTTEIFKIKANTTHNYLYNYDKTEYTNIDSNVLITCKYHGDFTQNAYHHIKGSGCPKCVSIISKQEVSFVDFIKSIYTGKVITNTRKIIKPYELDVYLPDKQIAFEYNGNYWHEEGINKPIGYHQMKTDRCEDKGIELFHIWGEDWVNNKEGIKNNIFKILI